MIVCVKQMIKVMQNKAQRITAKYGTGLKSSKFGAEKDYNIINKEEEYMNKI